MRRILIIGVFIFAGLVSCGEIFAFPWDDIPVYPGSQKIKDNDLIANNVPIKASLYKSSATNKDILYYYDTQLTKAGWTRAYCDQEENPQVMTFQKKGKYLCVSAQESPFSQGVDERVFLVAYSEKGIQPQGQVGDNEKVAQDQNGPPTSDLPGEDVANVPRYPETVRVTSTKTSRGMTATYFSHDAIDTIAEYYRQNMPSHNWKMAKEFDLGNLPPAVEESLGAMRNSIDISGTSLVFKSDVGHCFIALTQAPEEMGGIEGTLIAIQYEKK